MMTPCPTMLFSLQDYRENKLGCDVPSCLMYRAPTPPVHCLLRQPLPHPNLLDVGV